MRGEEQFPSRHLVPLQEIRPGLRVHERPRGCPDPLCLAPPTRALPHPALPSRASQPFPGPLAPYSPCPLCPLPPCLSPCLSTAPSPLPSAPAAPPAFYTSFAEIKFTHHTMCLFQRYTSMILGAFTELHKHRHIHLEYFHLERKPHTFPSRLPIPPPLHLLSLAPGYHVPSFCLYGFACSRHFTQTGLHNMCSSLFGFLRSASCFQSSSISQGVSPLPFLFNGQIIFHCMGLLMLNHQVASYSL